MPAGNHRARGRYLWPVFTGTQIVIWHAMSLDSERELRDEDAALPREEVFLLCIPRKQLRTLKRQRGTHPHNLAIYPIFLTVQCLFAILAIRSLYLPPIPSNQVLRPQLQCVAA